MVKVCTDKVESLIKVYVDEREKGSKVIDELRNLEVKVIVERLPVGDYVVSNELGIERKTVRDLVKSLEDNRLVNQAKRLAETFEKAFIIVEGDWIEAVSNPAWRGLPSALASLSYDYGIKFLYTMNPRETARVIKLLAEKESGARKSSVWVRVSGKPPLSETREWQLYLVQCLPGVGVRLAERLLKRFGSVRAVFNASVMELSKVQGMSEAKAREIVRILTAPFGGVKKGNKKGLEDFIKKE